MATNDCNHDVLTCDECRRKGDLEYWGDLELVKEEDERLQLLTERDLPPKDLEALSEMCWDMIRDHSTEEDLGAFSFSLRVTYEPLESVEEHSQECDHPSTHVERLSEWDSATICNVCGDELEDHF